MKNLFIANTWAYGITLGLYITVVFGLVAQIFLGIIQILMAVYLYFIYKKLPATVKMKLNSYAILVTLYAAVFVVSVNSLDDFVMYQTVLVFMVLPMLLGAFFVYITYTLRDFELNDSVNTLSEKEMEG